ncbi:hypothetical protein DMENIID0001_047640 [Sergentomyia squamirostris]
MPLTGIPPRSGCETDRFLLVMVQKATPAVFRTIRLEETGLAYSPCPDEVSWIENPAVSQQLMRCEVRILDIEGSRWNLTAVTRLT